MDFWRWVSRHFVPSEHNDHRPHLLRRSWLLFFLCVTLATEGFLVANLIARQSNANFLAAVVPGEIIALTNDERAQNSVGQLAENSQLDAAAQAKANDMAAKGYFSHVSPDGATPWQWIAGAGYQYQYAGENLAVRFIDSQDVVNAWMASPTHRENIVKPVYTQIGVGVAEGSYQGQPATYVVQYFGTPLEGAAVASAPALPVASAPVTRPVAKQTAASPAVEGASIAVPVSPQPASAASFTQSFVRGVMRSMNEPVSTADGLLGASAALIIVALAATFFVRLQLQHSHMLVSAVAVAALAFFFIMLNGRLLSVGQGSSSQAASPAEAAQTQGLPAQGGVVIDSSAAEVGFALFPQ